MESLPIDAMRFKVHLTERLNLQLQKRNEHKKIQSIIFRGE